MKKNFLATSAVPFSASHLLILQYGPSKDPLDIPLTNYRDNRYALPPCSQVILVLHVNQDRKGNSTLIENNNNENDDLGSVSGFRDIVYSKVTVQSSPYRLTFIQQSEFDNGAFQKSLQNVATSPVFAVRVSLASHCFSLRTGSYEIQNNAERPR